jgi:hypothetical protein
MMLPFLVFHDTWRDQIIDAMSAVSSRWLRISRLA